MSFLAAEKKDHLARLGEGGGSELNGQCPFKIISFFVDVIPYINILLPTEKCLSCNFNTGGKRQSA